MGERLRVWLRLRLDECVRLRGFGSLAPSSWGGEGESSGMFGRVELEWRLIAKWFSKGARETPSEREEVLGDRVIDLRNSEGLGK